MTQEEFISTVQAYFNNSEYQFTRFKTVYRHQGLWYKVYVYQEPQSAPDWHNTMSRFNSCDILCNSLLDYSLLNNNRGIVLVQQDFDVEPGVRFGSVQHAQSLGLNSSQFADHWLEHHWQHQQQLLGAGIQFFDFNDDNIRLDQHCNWTNIDVEDCVEPPSRQIKLQRYLQDTWTCFMRLEHTLGDVSLDQLQHKFDLFYTAEQIAAVEAAYSWNKNIS